jgi:light-regulated signal transduction histidine kinase (bacteriophytochrome)
MELLMSTHPPKLAPKHEIAKCPTGIVGLDQITEGGLPKGNLSRLSRQEPRKRVCSANSLIEEVVKGLESELKDRQVEWQIAELPSIECDPSLFKQVLVNLLSNALKFTRTRQPAIIEIGQTTIDGEVVIFVRDNGVGFNMKYADKLFGLFQRLHRQQDFEGTGVGLAIVQRIMHRHGGRVWVEAELDKGATFYLSLHGCEAGKKGLSAAHAAG